jgi:dipeptidase D
MTEKIEFLAPERVWHYFLEICKIPRPSKHEEKIISYLVEFGKKFQLETVTDDVRNVLIRKKATLGNENRKSVILQSHMDMVCEKNSETRHDFMQDAIQPYIENGWIKAKGTTLGADDGIGIAAQLAVLESTDIPHGPIECLFTVDEETGLTGAFGLKKGFLKSSILLNLDSEDEGQLFIGCAGGRDTTVTFNHKTEPVPATSAAYTVSITGLKGGHSGDDINKGLGNAVKLLNRFLWNARAKFALRIASIDAGNLRNAIAREGFALVTVPVQHKDEFEKYGMEYEAIIREELNTTEKNLAFSVTGTVVPATVITQDLEKALLNSLYACPHGVIEYSRDIKDLVETSTNLASVKFVNSKVLVTTSQRSSVETARQDICDMVESVFLPTGATINHSEGYPGWKPNTDSEILRITAGSYQKLFSEAPRILAIHAGLECGLIGALYPGMDMVSFGPTIKGAHSPDERLEIASAQKFWDLLLDVLAGIPEGK